MPDPIGNATFPNIGVKEARLRMADLPGVCSIVDEPFRCDVAVVYGPRTRCVTIEWFAETVRLLLAGPTTAEAIAARIADAFEEVCAPNYTLVTVTHHPKDGVTLEVEALR